MHACVYILHTVIRQFLLQIAAWMSQATSFHYVIHLPTLISSSFKSCINEEKKKTKERAWMFSCKWYTWSYSICGKKNNKKEASWFLLHGVWFETCKDHLEKMLEAIFWVKLCFTINMDSTRKVSLKLLTFFLVPSAMAQSVIQANKSF